MVKVAAKAEKKIRGRVEINLVGEKEMKNINRHYRGINQPTDVLSFAWHEERVLPSALLGQLYLCYSYINRQAKRFKVSVKEEFTRSLVHGLLHLVGYHHLKKTEAKRMFSLQEKIVARLFHR